MGGQVLEVLVAGGAGAGGLVGANAAFGPGSHLVVDAAPASSSGPVAYSGFTAPVYGIDRDEMAARYAAAQAYQTQSQSQAPVYQEQQTQRQAQPTPQLG